MVYTYDLLVSPTTNPADGTVVASGVAEQTTMEHLHNAGAGTWYGFARTDEDGVKSAWLGPTNPITLGGAQTLSFFATDAEYTAWEDRVINGPYRVAGDVSANSPGDWTRINNNAENFRSNPSQCRWVQPGTGQIGANEQWPGNIDSGMTTDDASRFLDAALKATLLDDADLRSKVKTELLWQVNEWSVSPLNYDRWNPTFPGSFPSPSFELARWVMRWLHARDYLGRGTFTATENDTLDRWFYGWANWFTQIIHETNKSRWPNRWSLDWSGSVTPGTAAKSYDGGPDIFHPAVHLNNRLSCVAVANATIAAYLKWTGYTVPSDTPPSYGFRHVSDGTENLYKHGFMTFTEFLRFTCFPQGLMGDFERASTANPTLGWEYATAPVAHMCEAADAYARLGDFSLYDMTTTAGLNGTEGAPTLTGFTGGKTLRFLTTAMWRYVNDAWGRRYDGSVMVASNEVRDVQWARASRYYTDTFIQDGYRRSGSAMPAYPSSPKSGGIWGSQNIWRGEQNISPGILFCHGQMEHINPYPGA